MNENNNIDIVSLNDFLKNLIDLSIQKKTETIFYSGMTSQMAMLIYIMIMEKYKNDCFLYLKIPDNIYKTYSVAELDEYSNIKSLAKQMLNCINSGIHTIIIPYDGVYGGLYDGNSSHANMLIYKVMGDIHQIDIFDPHGSSEPHFLMDLEKIINKLQYTIKKYYLKKKKNIEQIYNSSFDICPIVGPQTQHSRYLKKSDNPGMFLGTQSSGLCGYWSYLIAELILKYPNLETSIIINELMKHQGIDINNIIRGFIFYNEDGLLQLYSKFNITDSTSLELYSKLHNYIFKKYIKHSLLNFITPNRLKSNLYTRKGGHKKTKKQKTKKQKTKKQKTKNKNKNKKIKTSY